MASPSCSVPSASSSPGADTTHLELRLAGRQQSPPSTADVDDLLDATTLSGVRTLDVALGTPKPAPPVALRGVSHLLDRLPRLEQVTLRLAGALDADTTAMAAGLLATCRRPALAYAVEFVLEADADVFQALAHPASRAATSLLGVVETSRALRSNGVSVRWVVPLVPPLVHRLESLFSLARDEGVDPVLAPGAASLDSEERLFAADFIAYRLLEEERDLHPEDRRRAYRALQHGLTHPDGIDAGRLEPVRVLHAVEAAPGIRWALGAAAPSFARSGVPTSPTRRRRVGQAVGRLLDQVRAVAVVFVEGVQAVGQWVFAGVSGAVRARPPRQVARRFGKVLLIGAYGGEHIGDAAILGGVLFRVNRRYGTTEAILMSQRPAHTRHLTPMLDTPFTIDVEAYEPARVRERLPAVDAVVFAGGPLIDLPKQLVRHLYTVSRARRSGKPFIMEGIGPGPFPRRLSEWTARRLVGMAERISVRTSTDADHPLMRGLRPEAGRDPAFDYLATRGSQLSRLRKDDREWIERLLQQTDGRLVIGLNLRPIRHLFTAGVPAPKRAEYTRFVEARFEERLAEGMRRFHRASSRPPCFVFFPMNAIQFGMSDLRSAYRVVRALRGDAECRVWEADASLDGVVALLRRLDAVISMRFHATIFALAQQRRVIGIDYRVGERDKVAALLGDFDQSENCCRIDELTPEWLVDRLSVLVGP